MNKSVCVLGLGYIGLPTAAILADKGYHVNGVDIREDVVETINKEVATALFIFKSERITRIGIIINPPPAPISPVKKPIIDPSKKISSPLGAIVLVFLNFIIVLGVFFIIKYFYLF